jgi:demethylmenaquinone methyltransferase/2-methoxy-6-polyprenyl-1,4-benzoquinol methylase
MANTTEQRKVAVAALLAVLFYRLQDERCRHQRQKLSVESVKDGSGEMFELVAPRYDLLNNIISLGLHKRWKRKAVDVALKAFAAAAPADPQLEILDLATGTADLAIDIVRRYGRLIHRVVAVDPSPRMLENAQRKITDAQLSEKILLHRGVAEELPSEWTGRFDACIIGFGVRNFKDRMKALSEVHRVLKKPRPTEDGGISEGGRLVILEIVEPRGRGLAAPFGRFFLRTFVPLLGALFSLRPREYSYLQKSARLFPPIEDFTRQMGKECCLEATRVQQLGPLGLGPTIVLAKPEIKKPFRQTVVAAEADQMSIGNMQSELVADCASNTQRLSDDRAPESPGSS